MSDHKINGKSFVMGAVIGSVLGAATALLIAPKSGRELRKDIAEQTRGAAEKTQQLVGNISRKTQEIAGNVGHKTQQIVKNVGSTASEWAGIAKEAASNAVSEVKAMREARKETASAAALEAGAASAGGETGHTAEVAEAGKAAEAGALEDAVPSGK